MSRALFRKAFEEIYQDSDLVQNITITNNIVKFTAEGFRLQIVAKGIVSRQVTELSDEDLRNAFSDIVDEYYGDSVDRLNFTSSYTAVYFKEDLSTDEKELTSLIESFIKLHKELDISPVRNSLKDKYSSSIQDSTYYLNVVKKVKLGMEMMDRNFFDRTFLGFDQVDKFITVGESVNRTPENSYREHVVPCDYLTNVMIDMIEQGYSDTEVAVMLKQNLAIVLITPEEARVLDQELELKTDMPTGWELGDDIMARLVVAGIELK